MRNYFVAFAIILLLCSSLSYASSVVEGENNNSKAEAVLTKYLVFREDCYDRFFTKFDFFGDTSCIAFTLGKLVGYVIVAGSTVFKLP